MPSFLAIGWLILTTFENLMFFVMLWGIILVFVVFLLVCCVCVSFFLVNFEFSIFALYGILGKTDLCKRMPRGMPSFSTIACLILTTFQNFRFSRFPDLPFPRFPYPNLNFSCPLINQPLLPWASPSIQLYFPWVSQSLDSWAPISWRKLCHLKPSSVSGRRLRRRRKNSGNLPGPHPSCAWAEIYRRGTPSLR